MRPLRAAAALVLLAVAVTACSRSGTDLAEPKPGFCEAAARYDRRVERNAGIAEQITILEKLERNAPKDVAEDATLFLTTMREFQQGDKNTRDEIRADPRVQEAVENVNRRAAEGCGFFESEPGDGS
jgi:hypothetical protein